MICFHKPQCQISCFWIYMHSLEEILTVQIEQEGSQIAQVAIDCTKTQIQRWIESAPERVSPRSLCIASCSRTTSLSSRGHQLIRWPTNFHKSPTLSPSLLFFWTLCYYFTSSADCTILSLPLGFPSPCLVQMNERERETESSNNIPCRTHYCVFPLSDWRRVS